MEIVIDFEIFDLTFYFSVAETILDTQKNIDKLQNLSKKALSKIQSNFTSSQTFKLRLLSEKVKSRNFWIYFWLYSLVI